jgi:hypothetical protein
MPNDIYLFQAFGHHALMYTFLNITIDLKRTEVIMVNIFWEYEHVHSYENSF